jgi:hypothetical protein
VQVVVAAPLSGSRARLVEALREVALPGIALAGAEPVAPGAGSVAAIVWFEWGPVLLDVTNWASLDARAADLRSVAFGGGLLIQPPCEILVLEPGSTTAPDEAPADADDRPRRTSASSAQHLRDTLIELARERYGRERWSTADVLWTMDLLHLPSAVNAVVDENVLIALGFPVSRVPLLDGRGGVPVAAAPMGPADAPPMAVDPDATAYLAPLPVVPDAVPVVPADAPVVSPPVAPSAAVPLPGRPFLRSEQWDEPVPNERAPRRVSATLIAAGLALAAIIVSIVVFLNLGHGGDNAQPGLSPGAGSSDPAVPGSTKPAATAPVKTTPASAPSATLAVPAGYTARAADAQVDCAAHSYGQAQQFFTATPCVQVQRQLLSGTVEGRPVVMSVREVIMPSAAGASALRALIDTSGTGNVNDQLREGATFPGAPGAMPTTDYASTAAGVRVRIVEGGFTDGGAANSPALQAAVDALAAAR